jgi:hypothetical protein
MPCKIQIKENLTKTVEDMSTKFGDVNSTEGQIKSSNWVNKQFKANVLSYSNGVRKVTIPTSLIDLYYNHEKRVESNEFSQKKPVAEVSYQAEGMPMTEADDATVERVKLVAEKMGVSFAKLTDYLAGNPDIQDKGITALADQFKGIIAIAAGKEAGAITEETIHIATSILEQTHPEIVTELIKEIGKFKIYKTTLDAYKGKKAYQLANGKPNIRKIKKEAVDKLIAEVIVQDSPNVDANPELLELTMIERIKNFWKNILSAFGGDYRKAGINLFEQAGSLIMDEGVGGTVEDIQHKDVYYQSAGGNNVVDSIYDTISTKAADITGPFPETADKKRHYKNRGEEVALSVTEKIAAEKAKKGKGFAERTPLEKQVDDIKAKWGTAAHNFIEDYIKKNLIDSNGYVIPDKESTFPTELDDASQAIVKRFVKELVGSYPQGTRFMVEVKTINEAEPGGLASTIDLVVIEPYENEEGEADAYVDIYDWKFSGYDPEVSGGDIPWFKQTDWKAQMGEYTRMLRNYGVSGSQIRKSRMIPFKTTYNQVVKNQPEKGLTIKSIEVGNINSVKESKVYLLPVSTDNESTGYTELDKLVKGLRIQYNKLWDTFVPESEQFAKDTELRQISKAIRVLHMQHDFTPLLSVAATFYKRFRSLLVEMKDIDFSTLSDEDLLSKLQELVELKNSAEKYMDLGNTFSLISDKDNPEHKSIASRLANLDDSIKRQLAL